MIKVLVVDDDKLVRKGLVSAMPWQDYDMQVIGEASNGEKALEVLEAHPVDLLLTDLAMPVMSGIELMRNVREKFPHIYIAVLTLHQDFEYVQEALRLGAIDYIAKVELEKERFDEVLERISGRIRLEKQRRGAGNQLHMQGGFPFDQGYALLSLNSEPGDEGMMARLADLDVSMLELDSSLWLWAPSEEPTETSLERLSKEIVSLDGWVIIELKGLSEQDPKNVYRSLTEYREKTLFYEYEPHLAVYTLSLEPYIEQLPHSENDVDALKKQWSSPEWIRHDLIFTKLIQDFKMMKLPQARLIGLLYSLVDEWNRLFHAISGVKIELRDSFDFWYQVEEWLRRNREMIRQTLDKSSFSKEIIDCVLKAVTIVHEELGRQVTAVEVAQKVNMSRSYFSQCFKDIVGQTFNDYFRHVRIEKAKEHLLYTNKTILWIAEQTGYMDEKYFSRIFREQVGMLPSEFRQSHRTGREVYGG